MAQNQSTSIVNETVTVQAPSQPSMLQQSIALVSVGGTTLTAGTYQYCADVDALTAIQSTSGNYEELPDMATAFTDQGTAVGFFVLELGAQTTPQDGIAALNTYQQANPKVFYGYVVPTEWDTMPAPAAPTATATSDTTSTLPEGTYYVQVAYLNANGAIGNTSPVTTVDITAYDADSIVVTSPDTLTGADAYLVYAGTSSDALYLQNGSSGTDIGTNYTIDAPISTTTDEPPLTLATMISNYSGNQAKLYFFVLTSLTNMHAYGSMSNDGLWSGYKAGVFGINSPTAADSEYLPAAIAYLVAEQNPSATDILPPMQYQFLTGCTPWPSTGYSADIQNMTNLGVNYAGTGAEGGISNTCLFWGTLGNLEQISYWYGIDWAQIQSNQTIAAAIINGSNTQPPLRYRPSGINTLLEVAQQVIDDGVSFGCLEQGTVTAVPFATYVQQNPSDYEVGDYNGFTADVVGQNGFRHIQFNINVQQLPA